jgi:hypothetical protein
MQDLLGLQSALYGKQQQKAVQDQGDGEEAGKAGKRSSCRRGGSFAGAAGDPPTPVG